MNLIRIIFSIVCTLAAAGLAVRVAVEHEARVTLEQQGAALREQLSQMDQVIAENQRLSNLVAQADGPPSRLNERAEVPSGTDKGAEASSGTDKRAEAPSGTDKRSKELVRLRGEVEVLRQQSKEIETLREDTRQARAAQPTGPVAQSAGQAATMSPGATTADGSQFEILKAEYWTENARMDVTGELAAKLRNEALNTTATNAPKTSANNDLKGDPDLGHTKTLTVVYQVGGITMTNEFREGQPVILPGQ
jgi:hypothetical protein